MQLRVPALGLAMAIALAGSACGSNGSNGDPTGAGGAPATHTIQKGSASHAPGLTTPLQNCVSCHGADLRGSGEAPSCYSCHGKKWS